MWLEGRICKERGRIMLTGDLKEDSVFTKAEEQRVKHMLAMTASGRQLRLDRLGCEICGMSASLKLSQTRYRSGTMGRSGIPVGAGRGGSHRGWGRGVLKAALSQPLVSEAWHTGPTARPAALNSVSLSTHFPAEPTP